MSGVASLEQITELAEGVAGHLNSVR